VVFWVSVPCCSTPRSATRCCWRSRRGALRRSGRPGHAKRREPPDGLADHRRIQRGRGDRPKVANALGPDWRGSGWDLVLDGHNDDNRRASPCGGGRSGARSAPRRQAATQDAGVAAAHGELLAFSDANSIWIPASWRRWSPRSTTRGPYAAARWRFVQAAEGPEADNQEGSTGGYEMAVARNESRLFSVTAGNGAIYASPRALSDHRRGMDHDLCFAYMLVKRGWRAVDVRRHARARRWCPRSAASSGASGG